MTARNRKGFTLVELLVVIGIIAVLISILLPSLAKARETALTIQCSANLRSIGQSLQMYVDDNKGYYPYGIANVDSDGDPATNATTEVYWPATLAYYMQGKQAGTAWSETINNSMAYFKCPAVNIVPTAAWTPFDHYGTHPIAFMAWFWTSGANGNARLEEYKQVWLAKNSTEKAIIWDATVRTTGGDVGRCQPVSGNVSGDQFWWGDYLVDAPAVWQTAGWLDKNTWGNGAISVNGTFRDLPQNGGGSGGLSDKDTLRFRHNGNTTCNILFGDGHVESRKATQTFDSLMAPNTDDTGRTDLLRRNFEMPWPVPGLVNH